LKKRKGNKKKDGLRNCPLGRGLPGEKGEGAGRSLLSKEPVRRLGLLDHRLESEKGVRKKKANL